MEGQLRLVTARNQQNMTIDVSSMNPTSRELGIEAEKYAAQLLMSHGLKLLEQNVKFVFAKR